MQQELGHQVRPVNARSPSIHSVSLYYCIFVSGVFILLIKTNTLTVFLIPLVDVPSPPGNPEVKDKTKSSITLSWTPPEKDGGSPIKGYIIEVHEEGFLDWRRVNPAEKLHPSTEITVPDLKEGKKCRFRIYAVNAAGDSEPARTADILVQDILSKKQLVVTQ